jgi:hypothetical protein
MPNGKRLNHCFAELHGALIGTLSSSGDDWAWRARDCDAYRQARASTRQSLGTAIGDGKIHREAMRIIAEHAICRELRAGRLALWAMFDNVPAQMDHHWSHLIDRYALTVGCINPSNEPPSSLKDATLWILLADWQTFKSQLLSSRDVVLTNDSAPHVKKAGRPNQRDEALAVYDERLRLKLTLPSKAAEANFIRGELARRHASDAVPWSYEAKSIQRAIRNFR